MFLEVDQLHIFGKIIYTRPFVGMEYEHNWIIVI